MKSNDDTVTISIETKNNVRHFLTFATLMLLTLGLRAQTPVQEEDMDARYATNLLKAGTPAPDFTLNDINGNPVSFSSFKGKTTVLVFWASWCPDCRAEVPGLKTLFDKADKEKVAFVSVSFDRSLEALKAFDKENDLPGTQLFDPAGKKESTVAAAYGVLWIPSLYLIDSKGNVVLGTVVLDKIEKSLLGSGKKFPVKASREVCSDENCAN